MKKIKYLFALLFYCTLQSCKSDNDTKFSGTITHINRICPMVAIDTNSDHIPDKILGLSMRVIPPKGIFKVGDNIEISLVDDVYYSSIKIAPFYSIYAVYTVENFYSGTISLLSDEGFLMKESSGKDRQYKGSCFNIDSLYIGMPVVILRTKSISGVIKPFFPE